MLNILIDDADDADVVMFIKNKNKNNTIPFIYKKASSSL